MVLNANNKTGLGNINPLLYNLFSTSPALFHDVTTGNNIASCVAGTLGCVNGSEGYNATAGYDLATGLGSLDIGAFSSNVATAVAATGKVPTIGVQVVSTQTSSIAANAYVSSSATSTTPTGTVSFSLDGGTPLVIPLGQVGPYGASAGVSFMGTYAVGNHTITALYSGDANYSATSTSTTVIVPSANGGVSIAATPSTLTINSATAHSGSWVLNLTSTNGYTGILQYNVALSQNSPVPASGCVFYQGDAGISPNATIATTLTFSYSAADCSGANVVRVFGDTRNADTHAGNNALSNATVHHNAPLLAIGFTGMFGLACFRRRRVCMSGLLALAAMAGMAGLSGCGSGATPLSPGTTSGTGSGTITAAPKGTYSLVISVLGYPNRTPTASTNVTLVIQ